MFVLSAPAFDRLRQTTDLSLDMSRHAQPRPIIVNHQHSA